MSTSLVLKRKQPEPRNPKQVLTAQERAIHKLIQSKREEGIWSRDIKDETNIPEPIVNKCIKALILKKLVKEVPNIKNKGKKTYMAVEFDPTEELTGGLWYDKGELNVETIEVVKKLCTMEIRKMTVATIEEIANGVRSTRALKFEIPTTRIHQIVKTLVLNGQLVEVRSTGFGEFSTIPDGVLCYKSASQKPKTGALASVPCGVCPHMSICTPDGLVSPNNCVYYNKWLDF